MWLAFTRGIRQWRGLLITAPSVAGLVIAATSLGLFQLLEWATLDHFFRLRPREPTDPRIVIVTINESDASHIGQWPIPDGILAQIIQNLNAQQPRAIGMDLYRDLIVQPGHEELVKVFKSTPNLIGVEKLVGDKVGPPPILSALDQVGLADLVLDGDGKVRRGLLSAKANNGKTRLGLATKLALIYLEKEGIELRMVDPKKKHLGLGKAVFIPLAGNEGGYVRTNTGGYQIFLNYRGTQENFHTISLTDVLENRIPADSLRDRIVFIGATGESFNDLFFTPYSSSWIGVPERTPGVIVHANLTSQILSAALEGRPLIRVWDEPIEWLLILVSSFIGAIGSWNLLNTNLVANSLKWTVFLISIFLFCGSLITGSFIVFLAGWWLPVVPPLLALAGSAMAIAGAHSLQLQREKSDLEILLETTTEHADAVTADLQDKAEKAVREFQRRLAQFMEAVPVGVAVLDADGKPYYTNRAAEQILGKGIVPNIKPSQLPEIYQNYIAGTDQLYPSDKLPLMRALRGEVSATDDIEIHRGDKVIPIESWGTPIYDDDGNVSYALVVFQDITERKKSEAERIKLTNELLQLNLAYSRFVPRQFLQLLNKESIIDVQLGDQVQQQMSVLFSDIRNFTTISEMMNPEDNFKFINAYLSRMEPLINANNGFIDKYIGDEIMALFSGDADNAVKAAISMLQTLTDYNTTRGRPGRPPIKIGIGINTGLMMLGTVGGHSRMEGTVISDAVNLASRIEGLTKDYAVSLLISHNTFLALNNANDYSIRLLDRVKVKGKSQLVTVYEVFDADPPELKEAKLATKSMFEQALFFFYLGKYQEAAQILKKCLTINSQDKVAQIYLQRCQEKKEGIKN